MKKKIFAAAIAVICFAVMTSSTLAYFTTSGIARNVITSDGIDIELVEQQLVNGDLTAYPDDEVMVLPGRTVSKIVSVNNLDREAWIRVGYTVVFKDANGTELTLSEDEKNALISINSDTQNWTEQDGWWYYNSPVDTDEGTTALFSEVTFSGPNMGNEYQQCSATIKVIAQAVQTIHNGETVLEAAGWPELN